MQTHFWVLACFGVEYHGTEYEMRVVASILLLTGFVLAALHYWKQVARREPSLTLQAFFVWVGKGVIAPALLWMIFNSGVLMAPILPEMEMVRAASKWIFLLMWMSTTAAVLPIIASYWAALTFGSLIVAVWHRLETHEEFVLHGVFWSALMLPLVGLILYFANWAWAGFALLVWFWPLLHNTIPLLPTKKPLPSYSGAIAKMKFGKYQDAELEVIRELEECEDDFEGWMMLAELYANHFNDLPVAEQTVMETCAQPNVNPSQIAVGLHRLADWHLKLAQDPVAARLALEGICQRFPGTHLARMARQRIARLPATREELREQRESKPIHLPALNDGLDEVPEQPVPNVAREETAAQANRWVEKLNQDPDDVPAREELARLFAEGLDRPDWAIEQLELLMQMPEQPERKRAEWLSLMAAWQIRHLRDNATARKTLERLIREYPQSAQAFAAQRRINLIDTEAKMRQARLASKPAVPSPPRLGAASAGEKSASPS
jgi:Tetratricopeptide repeat